MDRELKTHQTIDCFCSGTTAVTLIKQVLAWNLWKTSDSLTLCEQITIVLQYVV
jgi:hypothetical protein